MFLRLTPFTFARPRNPASFVLFLGDSVGEFATSATSSLHFHMSSGSDTSTSADLLPPTEPYHPILLPQFTVRDFEICPLHCARQTACIPPTASCQ